MDNSLPELTEESFKKLGQSACAVFAWRAAMRVLPLLGGAEIGLGFWPEADRGRRLSAVLAALDVVLPQLYLAAGIIADVDVADAFYTAYVHEDANAKIAATVARVASTAARVAVASDIAGAVSYVTIVVDSITGDDFRAAMQWDLYQLLQWQLEVGANSVSAPSLSVTFAPLWKTADGRDELPDGWMAIINRWQRVLEMYGYALFCASYLGLLAGEPWDIESSLERFNRWLGNRDANESGKSTTSIQGAEDPQENDSQPLAKLKGKRSSGGIATTLADKTAAEDHLGRTSIVDTLAKMLASPEQSMPLTIALLGEWGAGKTSVIKQLETRFKQWPTEFDDSWRLVSDRDKHQPYRYIYATFNAWEYEQTDNIRAGLAQEVVNGLVADMSVGWRCWFGLLNAWRQHRWPFIWSMIGVLVAGGAVICGLNSDDLKLNTFSEVLLGLGVGGVLLKSFWTAKNILEHPLVSQLQTYLKLPSYGEHLGLIPVIKQQIKSLCELRLKGLYRHRLLVVVDDLDRCSPECIVETLDAIRLVMDLPDVVVLVAIDDRVAFRAVAEHYKKLSDRDRPRAAIARDYLGKIIQLPINLPKPAARDLNGYIANKLFTQLEPEQTDPPEKIQAPSVGNSLPPEANSPPIAGGGGAKSQSIAEMQTLMMDRREELEQFQRLASDLEFSNPRQLVRLKNAYRVLKGINLSAPKDSPFEHHALMLGLFWAEYLLQFPLENKATPEQGRRHQELALVEAISKHAAPADGVIKKMSEHFSDWLQKQIEGESRRLYFELMQLVSVAVLGSAEGGLLLSREALERYKSSTTS